MLIFIAVFTTFVWVLRLIASEMCKCFSFRFYTCGHTTDYKSLFQYQSCIKPAGSGLDIIKSKVNLYESRIAFVKKNEMQLIVF